MIRWDPYGEEKNIRKTQSKETRTDSGKEKKSAASSDQVLRDHLLYLLKGGGAHIGYADALASGPCN